eukprot:scpid41531/ scgid31590/ 
MQGATTTTHSLIGPQANVRIKDFVKKKKRKKHIANQILSFCTSMYQQWHRTRVYPQDETRSSSRATSRSPPQVLPLVQTMLRNQKRKSSSSVFFSRQSSSMNFSIRR